MTREEGVDVRSDRFQLERTLTLDTTVCLTCLAVAETV
jgi:hypothetical protein